MASAGAEQRPEGQERGWARLRRVAARAAGELEAWRRRALEAESECERLRALTEGGAEGMGEEIRRLRAENARLQERATGARQRLQAVARRIRRLEERG
jgi:hypothetical protein